jgi:hypothetical protein
MKTVDKISLRFNGSRPVIIHVLIGAVAGYFLLHPVSMVIYWFEFNDTPVMLNQVLSVFVDRLSYAFNLRMFPMALAFAIMGGFLGLGPGLFLRSLKIKQYKLLGSGKLLQKSIPSLINDGENEYVQFKPSLRYDYGQVQTSKNLEETALKSLAGFLNGRGGTILFGVHNSGQVFGLENDYWSLKYKNSNGFHKRLITLISSRMGKDVCSYVHITFHEIDYQEICCVIIEPAKRPVYLNQGSQTLFYRRSGTMLLTLNTSETVEYIKTRFK